MYVPSDVTVNEKLPLASVVAVPVFEPVSATATPDRPVPPEVTRPAIAKLPGVTY